MREDYEAYFQQLKNALNQLGYVSVHTEELTAEFFLLTGWKLSFECERYYGPMFGIFIIPPNPLNNRRRGYEVGLLMQVFEKLTGKTYGKPTIEKQVSFLIQEKDRVFGDPSYYESDYSKLNDLA